MRWRRVARRLSAAALLLAGCGVHGGQNAGADTDGSGPQGGTRSPDETTARLTDELNAIVSNP